MRNTTSKKSTFLFVNKTGSSEVLTRSEDDQKADVLSHVQQRRRRATRKEPKPEPWAQYASTVEIPTRGFHASETAASTAVERTSSIAPYFRSEQVQPHLLRVYPTQNESDPFYCTVAGNEASVQPLLSYAFSYFARSNFLAEAFAPISVLQRRTQIRHSAIMMERVRRCVGDDMVMYSTLAYSSSCLAWSHGRLENGQPPEYFIDKALRAVRVRLSDPDQPIDTWLLISIYALAITEFWNENPHMWMHFPSRQADLLRDTVQSSNAHNAHFRALQGLVERVGGWEKTDPYLLESMILYDKYLAFSSMTRPTLPLTWDPGPLMESDSVRSRVQRSGLHRTGKSFRELELSRDLADVLQDTAGYIRIARMSWRHSNVTVVDEGRLFLRLQALIHRLLSLDGLQGIDNCLRLAALLFLQSSIHTEGAKLSLNLVLQQLMAAVIDTDVVADGDPSRSKLWCLCTGAMTPEPADKRDWFIGKIVELLNFLSLDLGEQALQGILETYLFISGEQSQQVTQLINDINIRRGANYSGEALGRELAQSSQNVLCTPNR
ncbi:MAG: hypothetical protein M1820_003962 [Bogoriella megaspora]|nr:MAG: hypothetical protein M1820_003962 [Bogoriella megaspora]